MNDAVPTRSELISELESDEKQCFEAGRLNNVTDICLSIASVLSSLVATVLVSSVKEKLWVAGAFAALPAAFTSLQKIVDFRGRSLWYFGFSANLTALTVSLKYAKDPDLEDFAKRRASLEIEGDKQWAKLGRTSDSSVPGTRNRKRI